jgi:hypothetical protein
MCRLIVLDFILKLCRCSVSRSAKGRLHRSCSSCHTNRDCCRHILPSAVHLFPVWLRQYSPNICLFLKIYLILYRFPTHLNFFETRRIPSPGMWRHAALIRNDVSEDRSDSTIGVKRFRKPQARKFHSSSVTLLEVLIEMPRKWYYKKCWNTLHYKHLSIWYTYQGLSYLWKICNAIIWFQWKQLNGRRHSGVVGVTIALTCI